MTCLSQTQGTPAQPGVKKPVKITPKTHPQGKINSQKGSRLIKGRQEIIRVRNMTANSGQDIN